MDAPRPDATPSEPDRLAETIDVATARALESTGTSVAVTDGGPAAPPAPAPADSDAPDRAGRPVEMVEGSADLALETRELLRVRLRAVAIILLVGFLSFFVRNLFLVPSTGLSRDVVALDVVHVVVIAVQAAAVVVLTPRHPRSTPELRTMEAAIFGSALAFFALLQYTTLTLSVARGDAVVNRALASGIRPDRDAVAELVRVAGELMANIKTTTFYAFLLMLLYGLFIPNTWRRAAAAVAVFFGVSGVVQATVMLRTRDRRSMVDLLATFEQVSTNLLILVLAALVAVYGSHLIHALRVQAFEARRLGQYLLRRRIGGGGMGEVYLAEHQLLKRPCAVKLIRPDRAGDPVALRRFEREVHAMARLSHWNTIEVYDYGRTEDGTFYFVMEFLLGLPLDALVERHGPLPPGRAVYLLRQACDSLAEAHAAGLVHRDLKPANLFAARRGGRCDVTKVLDFGLVKTTGPEPTDSVAGRQGIVTGTPLYMSPEQATGDPRLGPRSDLYSLGAVAYFLLTGRPPHRGSSPMQVMVAVAREPVVPPSELRPGLPADLDRIVLRCLAKDPVDRFSSAESLGRALGSCSCAAEWDAALAASWWETHEPQAIASH